MPYKDPQARATNRLTYQRAHAEEVNKFHRDTRAANLEKARAYDSAYRQKHPDRMRRKQQRYRQAHPARYAMVRARRRNTKRELPNTFSVAEHNFCRAYFHYSCALCGNEEGFQWTIAMDHWIPLVSQDCPGTVATNMIPLCHGIGGCNNSKNKKDPEQWLRERFAPRKAAQILKKIRAYFAIVAYHSFRKAPAFRPGI